MQDGGRPENTPEPTNPDAFDYRQYLRSQNVKYIFSADAIGECHSGRLDWYSRLLEFRQEGIDKIRYYFPDETAPFVNALLFGSREHMDQSVSEAYNGLGLSHLLAISGLHVSVMIAILYFLLLRMGIGKEQTRIILLSLLPVYAIIAGGAPSVIRAVIMSWLVLFLSKWREKFLPMDGLAFSFILMLLTNPYLIYHVGFQLSFAVTAGIVLSGPLIQKAGGWLYQSLFVSVVDQIVSAPIILYHFYGFSLISPLLNILYIPVYTFIILPLSFISYFLISFFPHPAMIVVKILSFKLTLMNGFAEKVFQIGLFNLVFGKPELAVFFFTIYPLLWHSFYWKEADSSS